MPEHTDEEKLRDKFEKWATAPSPDGMGFPRSRIARNTNPDDGYYRDHDFNVAWIAWNEAIRRLSPAPQAGQVTEGLLVQVVICMEPGGGETRHIFSTREKAEAWAANDPRDHIFYDYAIDVPERHEGAQS